MLSKHSFFKGILLSFGVFCLWTGLHQYNSFASITVDGLMNDWGVTPGAYGNPSQWTPSEPGVNFIQEDQDPAVNFLNPGWGGQAFDVEAIYFKQEGLYAYYAIVTGFSLSGVLGEQAGDIAFDFGGNGSYEFGIETRGNAGFTQGGLYGNPTWQAPYFTQSGPYDLLSGTFLGATLFAYNPTTYIGNGHYVLEGAIPVSLFGSYWSNQSANNPLLTLHWTMSCGNDALDLNVPHSPEPVSGALIALGLGASALLRRKKASTR